MVIERCDNDEITKHGRLQRTEFYLGILDVKTKHSIRHLTGDKVGKLIRISGQIVRTHQVHPELCLGTFVCDDCVVTIRNVPQQFQYTQVLLKFLFLRYLIEFLLEYWLDGNFFKIDELLF